MRPHLSEPLRVVLSAALCGVLCAPVHSQYDGRGGRRGFGPGSFSPGGDPRGGMLGALRLDQVREELGITDEQRESIEDIQDDDSGRELYRESFARMQGASDEERAAIQAELQAAFQKNQKAREDRLRKILDAKQAQRLEQLALQRSGSSALLRDDVAESLGLDETQRQKLTALSEEYRTARESQGRNTPDDERQKLRDDFDARYLAILNDSQRAAWTARLGAPATYDLNDFSRRGFGGPAGNAPQQAAAAPTPAPVPLVVLPPPEGATVVSSFGAPAGEADDRSQEEAKFSFNFRYAPWVDVLKLFADRAGFTLDLNTIPKGTFNYYDDGTYTITQALDILNGYLLPKGYLLVRRDRFLVCLNIDQPIPPNLVPTVERDELYRRGRNELMTIVFPLEGSQVEDAVSEINLLVGPQGKAVGLAATNSVLVTDIGSNLRRIDALLQQISAAPESTVFKAYPLTHIAADEAETSVRALLGLQVGVTDLSAGNDRYERDDRDRRDSRYTPPPAAPTTQPRLYAELRTNCLMVTATPAQHRIVEEALKVVDVDESAAGGYARSRKPYLRVYEVDDSDPREVVKTLSVLVPGVVVNEDGRNEKIHIVATEEQHREVETLIRQLDGLGASEQVAVIPLVRMDPIIAATTLRSMFVRDGESAPTIEPDLYGRQLMIRGSSTQLAQAQQLLTQLGEDGTGQRRAGPGVLSTFPLAGRDPAELLPLLERAWEGTAPNPVRIIRPAERGPVRDVRTPGRPTPPVDVDLEAGEPAARAEPRPHGASRTPVRFAVQTETPAGDAAQQTPPRTRELTPDELDALIDLLAPQPAKPASPALPQSSQQPGTDAPAPDAAAPQPAPDAQPKAGEQPAPEAGPQANASAESPVTITVLGDDLVISARDPAVRQKMEELVETLMQAVPPRTSWTIFPLEYADVTITATMLEQLFPDSTVVSADSVTGSSSMFGGLTSSISSMTSGLAGMTGLSSSAAAQLRIVPYPPDNSLFVSGPSYKVREVEEMLRVLDSGELSASLRERTPRLIPVRYADIDDVYAMVKDVYKDALESEQDRGARNAANMFAAMMGGGRRGNDRGESQAAQLSLGVDRQTSQLIVSSSQDKFEEIKAMVEQIDRSALEARRTVKVVTLHNTSTAQVKGTVSTLMPRVVVSSTGSRPPAASSSSSSTSNGSSGGDNNRDRDRGPDSDQFRRMMEERMRALQQSQGGGDRERRSDSRPSLSVPFGGRSFGGDRGGFRGFDRGGDRDGGRGRD